MPTRSKPCLLWSMTNSSASRAARYGARAESSASTRRRCCTKPGSNLRATMSASCHRTYGAPALGHGARISRRRDPRRSRGGITPMAQIAAETWGRLRPLLDQALDLPRDAHAQFLAELSGGDAELRDDLARLLA